MGRTPQPKDVLTLEDHRNLGDQLRGVRVDILDMRETVRRTIGSATIAYQAIGRLLNAVATVENALMHEAAGEYSDALTPAELRALYGNGEGARGPRNGPGEALAGAGS